MIHEIAHVGITVRDMEESIKFYRDILHLTYQGEMMMEGKETDALFGKENTKARVAYLKGTEEMISPPVELIQFLNEPAIEKSSSLFQTSISEICFYVKDIEKVYRHLLQEGVECISEPQTFDFTKDGFGKSKALYFKDPNGIILELMENID
ncbi:MAG: VOC family protein [Tissierellia bacterium]|nr:VOC family protein [Tissierellia bacterium]